MNIHPKCWINCYIIVIGYMIITHSPVLDEENKNELEEEVTPKSLQAKKLMRTTARKNFGAQREYLEAFAREHGISNPKDWGGFTVKDVILQILITCSLVLVNYLQYFVISETAQGRCFKICFLVCSRAIS